MVAIAMTAAVGLIQHSALNSAWGTPDLLRQFAACVLRPAAKTGAIDLDYSSSDYWHSWWPGDTQPAAFLDGSEGRDVLVMPDRRVAVKAPTCGAGFFNAPGIGGGDMVKRCWALFEEDHRMGWLDSGFWVGYSLEQLASLQGAGSRHPLSISASDLITTFVPSRRVRYCLHPDDLIELLVRKQTKRGMADLKAFAADQRQIDKLRQRADDQPVAGQAPPHASYLTVLWSRDRMIRRRQMAAARQFLKNQETFEGSTLEQTAVIGSIAT